MTTITQNRALPTFSAAPRHPAATTAATPTTGSPPCRAVWASRVASWIAVAFLMFDATLKLLQLPAALEASARLGFNPETVFTIGMIQIVCLIVYLVPQTRLLGALLWTGYLGGAVVTHLRVGDPLLSHTLFPVYVALLLWAQLWVSDARLRSLLLFGPAGEPGAGPTALS